MRNTEITRDGNALGNISGPRFSPENIEEYLRDHLPYYECDDKDDYFYIVKSDELRRIALGLHKYLTEP